MGQSKVERADRSERAEQARSESEWRIVLIGYEEPGPEIRC